MEPLPLDHVAIAVRSIAESLPLFEAVTGAAGSERERVGSQGVDVVFLPAGDSLLELIEPLEPDSAIARFLGERDAGLHHIALRVPDLAAALERLAASGVRLIDREPRPGARGHRVAFIHPKSAGGVLIELVEG